MNTSFIFEHTKSVRPKNKRECVNKISRAEIKAWRLCDNISFFSFLVCCRFSFQGLQMFILLFRYFVKHADMREQRPINPSELYLPFLRVKGWYVISINNKCFIPCQNCVTKVTAALGEIWHKKAIHFFPDCCFSCCCSVNPNCFLLSSQEIGFDVDSIG